MQVVSYFVILAFWYIRSQHHIGPEILYFISISAVNGLLQFGIHGLNYTQLYEVCNTMKKGLPVKGGRGR
jgi:hypothetical protein